MPEISVVIITKNEALNIRDCILSAKKISNDIIVVDSGSTDATVALAENEGVRTLLITWKGYGEARNAGAMVAYHEWILSLDADERITGDLATSIHTIDLNQENIIYGFKRLNFFGKTEIRHGTLRNDRVFRLYNRQRAQWNLVPVHEKLVGNKIKRLTLGAYAEHYGIRNAAHYLQKKTGYAFLCAVKYKQEKRKFIAALRVLSPAFNFIQAYIFQLGFLDKRIGFIVARINAYYTSKKYQQLYLMLQAERKQVQQPGLLRNSLKWISSLLS
ncbi:MAG: glycosyltransferase family 2 protein [Ferruginibacter sp.]